MNVLPNDKSVSSATDSGITSSKYLTSSLTRDHHHRNGHTSSGTSSSSSSSSSSPSVVDRLSNKYSSSIHSRCTSPWRSSSSTYLDLIGGDDYNSIGISELRRNQQRHESSSSSGSSSASSTSSSTTAAAAASGNSTSVTPSRYSSLHKRRPPLTTVLTSHAQNDSAKAPTEVTVNDQRNNNTDDKDIDRPCFSNNNNDENSLRHDHVEDKLLKESVIKPTTSGVSSASDRGTILDPLSNFPTNLDNTELLTNNNARYPEGKIVIKVQGGDSIRIIDQVTEDTSSSSSSSINRLAGENKTIGNDDEEEEEEEEEEEDDDDDDDNPFDEDPFFKTRNTFADGILQNGLGERSTTTNTTSLPSSSSSTGGASGTWQSNNFRDVNEQIEESPVARGIRNRHQAHRDERCGLNGLRNIGNTCFMNSVIQCLSNTRPLLEYLLNEQYLPDINTTTSSMKGGLIKAFSQVIHELWEVGGDVVNTTAFKSQIQKFAPRFMGYSQQDAQEFLRYLLEGLHEDVNRVKVKPQPIHTDIPDHYSDSQKATESWKRYLRSEDSTIVDVFVGQLRSSLRCTSCDHVSVTLDPFWDLSLPIPSTAVKLSQCLEHFTREEVLDGDEKPICSKCQMRRKCTKSFSIQKFPKILVIHLKRFSPMERFRRKLNVLVDFPLTGLDLSAFATSRGQGCTYNLYGVANHSGTTYSGHYTAYCKHPFSGEWHEYNDTRVSSVSAQTIVSSEAYVLFYEQQPHSSHL
ncbi:ubiquitin carboxyl-terminal hydrolase 2-like isoform X3 [Leptopilina boulardi]|uniref:ubiquitin carboxyl-terminal hydrolase 2-like isoform X3 n=1 Tax=Leptopilina boulardi TaxID=63433 RepID=UPI0021F63AD6|nr:ubiquitin carboxyl-terminal hydrolase 2-like isoform X3 [Leptopilina boulardi]